MTKTKDTPRPNDSWRLNASNDLMKTFYNLLAQILPVKITSAPATAITPKVKPELIEMFRRLPKTFLATSVYDFLSLQERKSIAELHSANFKDISITFKKRLNLHDKPKALIPKLLAYVVQGEQDKADKLLKNYGTSALLQRHGNITDSSGRTFENITTYEYAWWAGDTSMRQMLEKHMDEDTRMYLLKRCEAIDNEGLVYEQNGIKMRSKHFDFTPLIEAYTNYIEVYDNWVTHPELEPELRSAWMAIGMKQRDLPVHVINEYCRDARSSRNTRCVRSHELDNGSQNTYLNIYPLAVSSGLGVDFALFRGKRDKNALACPLPHSRALLDLNTIRQLEIKRADEALELLELLRSKDSQPINTRPG